MFTLLTGWLLKDPVSGILILCATALIFGVSISKHRKVSNTFWNWFKGLIHSAALALAMLGLIILFQAYLSFNSKAYQNSHDSLLRNNINNTQELWGNWLNQTELKVHHFVYTQKILEFPSTDPSKPPLFQTVIDREQVVQNSIGRFRGKAVLTLSEPDKRAAGAPLFNTYFIEANFNHVVVNTSDQETEANFWYTLPAEQNTFEDFTITVNGVDISSELRFQNLQVTWSQKMKPHETIEVNIAYKTTGMNGFTYKVVDPRQLQDFEYVITLSNTHEYYRMIHPQTQEMEPKRTYTSDVNGIELTWRLDNIIAAPEMGIAYKQYSEPYAPYEKPIGILSMSASGYSLLVSALVLTLIIRGQPVVLKEFAYLSAAFTLQFLTISGLADTSLSLTGAYLSGMLISVPLTFLIFRNMKDKAALEATFFLVAFFTFVYPLQGLDTILARQTTYANYVHIGLLIYLFAISLLTRLHLNPRVE